MSIQEQRRAAFEAWFVEQEFIELNLDRLAVSPDLYEQDEVEAMWTGWIAALDSVVIELPDREAYSNPDCAGAAIFDCASRVEDAGLKVKP